MKKIINIIAIGILSMLLLNGCATATKPVQVYSKAGFQPNAINKIYVLPVVDNRIDKKSTLELDKIVHERVEQVLKKRNYPVICVRDPAARPTVTDEALKQVSPEWIKGLGPSSAEWVMLFTLEDLKKQIIVGSTATAEMTMTIFDKQAGEVAWRDKALGSVSTQGPLLMGTIAGAAGLTEEKAVENATQQMLIKLPQRPQ